MSDSTQITIAIACSNAAGQPDFFATTVEATPEQVDNGDHYEMAKEKAYDNDYEDPMICFDQDEMPGFLLTAINSGAIPIL